MASLSVAAGQSIAESGLRAAVPETNQTFIFSSMGAEVELAFIGAVLGDVGQPDLVAMVCAELAVDEVVVDRGSGLLFSPRFLAKIDQMRS